ncbi:hypothetical protein ARMGADRAFT_571686 [Armillaria gallica]|uniref:Uncharacterized protein n=1 Tax=Armillaria gallica TaxID=47427 RepID=A0A2H3DW00_ARMGA|nr:hypothetical protein ARMGADRAFT_571686 [Armillaria gallica]
MHGIYTGILAVTLWNIITSKRRPIRRTLVAVVVLLYALITIDAVANLSSTSPAFVKNGQSFWTVTLKLNSVGQAVYLEAGIAASLSTILADSYIIWCCWTVWGRSWLIVLLPILSLISATVSKIIDVIHGYISATNSVFFTLYMSFSLATTLWCTLFIIFRILTVTGVRRGAGSRLRVFHHFIEVLVESSALYSIFLILCMAFFIRENLGWYFLDTIAAIMKGVAPTLLVGRVATGHTLPTEEHDRSMTMSALRFQVSSSRPSHPSTSRFQESTMQSAILETDIEAQRERSDSLVVVVERTQSGS